MSYKYVIKSRCSDYYVLLSKVFMFLYTFSSVMVIDTYKTFPR